MVSIPTRHTGKYALFVIILTTCSRQVIGTTNDQQQGLNNYVKCPRGKLPEKWSRGWPKDYAFKNYASVRSFCAASDAIQDTVGCNCPEPKARMRCERRQAGRGFHRTATTIFCHENCECGQLDDDVDQPVQYSVSDLGAFVEETLDELKDLSVEDDSSDDGGWTEITFHPDEGISSSGEQQVPQSPDEIAASSSGSQPQGGSCVAGSSRQSGGRLCGSGGVSLPLSTRCSGNQCSHYSDCDEASSSSVSTSTVNRNLDPCLCRPRHHYFGEGDDDDWLFLGECRGKGGLRRRAGHEDDKDKEDLCLCNSTYVSATCCNVKDGMVWEAPGLKRAVLS